MSILLKQSDSRTQYRILPFHLVSPLDGVTVDNSDSGGRPQISKQGGAFVNTNATLSFVANGYYTLQLSAGEVDTLGLILVRFKSVNCLEYQIDGQVVAFDPYSGPWATIGGTGVTFTYTVYDTTAGKPPLTPLQSVNVWVTSDSGGVNIVASGVTNQLGQVVFNLPADTYYFWQQRLGYNFTNPVTEVVG